MKAKVGSCVLKDVRNLNMLPLVSISKCLHYFWLALSCLFFISSIKYSRWYKWTLHPWCIRTNAGDQQSRKEIWGRRSDESLYKKKEVAVIRTNNCDDDQVLFMDVSLFSMCQSESLGTGNSVDMSITSGVSSKKKKVRRFLKGHIGLRLIC